MNQNGFLFPLLIIINVVYSMDTLINVDLPYSSGVINVPYKIGNSVYINGWFEDTITFSTGTKITFLDLGDDVTLGLKNALGVRRYSFWTGGLVFLDTISNVGYEYDTSLTKKYHKDPRLQEIGSYSYTVGNPDTVWNNALSFPDSFAPNDTFAYVIFDTITYYKSKAFCSQSIVNLGLVDQYFAGPIENFNSIVYIKTPDNSHIKLQISEITLDEEIVNGPDSTFINTRLGSFKLRWAVDSLGNGKFKKDNAEINVKNGLTGSKNNVIFYSLVNGHPYLFLSDKISLNNASEIRVYDIRGRTIVSKHIKSLRPISLSQFSKGIYIASRSSGNKAFNCKFTLSK